MRYHYPLVLVLAFLADTAFGQTTDTVALTLDQSIQYALEHAVDIQNALVDEEIAKDRVNETIGMGLPQIDGTVQLAHNSKLQRLFFAVTPDNPFTGDLTDIPEGSVIGTANFFQLPSSGNAGVNVNQLIFNGSYFVGLQASKAYKELSYKETDQTSEQVIESVRKAFYVALINKERVKLFETNIARVDSLLRDTKAMFENGFAESIDVDRIQVNLNNLITERDNFLNLQELSLELLKFQMNYPQAQPIDIAGEISDLEVVSSPDAYADGFTYEQRPDYRVLAANKRLQELNVKNKYAESLPSLSAFANLGYATQSQTIGGLFKTETDLEDDGLIGPDKWYPYVGFGVTLNVPIFSGLQRSSRIQQEKLALKKIENSENQLKSSIDVQIKQARINFVNNKKVVQSQRSNMELSDRVARVTRVKFEQGVGSNLEVVEAESDLKEAQINYYNALYDLMVSQIDLEKAYGHLLDNTISQSSK